MTDIERPPRMVNRPRTPWRLRPYKGPKVLVWRGKYDPVYIGPLMSIEDEDAAYLRVFTLIDRLGYYWIAGDAQRDKSTPLDQWRAERAWIKRARAGSMRAARRVVDVRSERHYEYERVRIDRLTPPERSDAG